MKILAGVMIGVCLTIAVVFGYSRIGSPDNTCNEAVAIWQRRVAAKHGYERALEAADEQAPAVRAAFSKFLTDMDEASTVVLQNPDCFSVQERVDAQKLADAVDAGERRLEEDQ